MTNPFTSHPRLWLLAALMAAAGLAALSPAMNPYHITVVGGICVAIILAVSLNLVLGHTGQFSLGHASFMSVGAFTATAAANLIGRHDGLVAAHALLIASLLAGGLMAALAGLLVGLPSLRLKGDYLAIVTLGFGEMLVVLLQNAKNAITLDPAWRARLPWVGSSSIEIPYTLGIPKYAVLFWALALAAITLYVCQSLVKSAFGLGLAAVRDNEIAAESCGISATRAKVLAFTIGAFFAGLAGGLFAHATRAINPDAFGFNRSMEVVLIVILGGIGRNWAVAAAAIGVTLLAAGLRKLPDLFPSASGTTLEVLQNPALLFAVLLVVLMIVRPQGLFSGWKKPTLLGGAN